MLFYNLVILLYWCAIHIASLFNEKARKWVLGRKHIFREIEKTMAAKKINRRVYWFHCASLGEFEQGRPVLEQLKKSSPEIKIVLTFFSPSGFEVRKDYTYADAVFYLPLDFKHHARKFITLLNPEVAVFIKYEFWLNYLHQLNEKGIPTYLVSAVFRPSQHFFKGYGSLFFKSLRTYKTIFVQDAASFALLKEKGLSNVVISGDTRFDRVQEIAQNRTAFTLVSDFCATHKILIAGSSWPKDEIILAETFSKLKQKHPDLKLIIAPHEIHPDSIEGLEKTFQKIPHTRYTRPLDLAKADVLIIDTIGMLSGIYRYGMAAYLGGGFNDGIHNILEALVYQIPVAFGPNHQKFIEASESISLHITREISNSDELFVFFDQLLSDESYCLSLNHAIKKYMDSKTGATQKVVLELQQVKI